MPRTHSLLAGIVTMLIHASETVQAAHLTSKPMEAPMFLNGWLHRRALRLTMVEKLKAQIAIERACVTELKVQNDHLLKEVVRLRGELDQRDLVDVVAAAPSPSAVKH